MNVEYGIKNFRVFDKDGERFNLKPITMLTGANCAGKSSLVKSIMLLKQFLDKPYSSLAKNNISFTDQSININGIDTVINNKSGDYKDVVFSLSKTGSSDNVKYTIEYTFSSAKGDYFNNGWLKNLQFACEVDGISDVFLSVAFENYIPVIKTLNLTGNIQKVFMRDMDLATYLYHHQEHKYTNQKERDIYFQEKLCFEALISRIYDNPLNSTLPLLNPPSMRERKDSNFYDLVILPEKEQIRLLNTTRYHIFRHITAITLQQLLNTNNLLYLPVLKTVGEKNAQALKSYLLNKSLIRELFPIEKKTVLEGLTVIAYVNNDDIIKAVIKDYKGIVEAIIADFKTSGLNTFNEYYSALVFSQLKEMNNCEALAGFFYEGEFLSVTSDLFKLPFDVDRSGNVRKIAFDKDNAFNADVNLTIFQKVYFLLSCLQRLESRTSTIINHTPDILKQPIYELESDPAFVWEEKSASIFGYTTSSPDVPMPLLYYNYTHYINDIIRSLYNIEDFKHISQYDSFLCPVQRSYSVYDKSPLNKILVEYIGLREQSKAQIQIHQRRINFINKWAKELGIGSSILFELNKEKTDIKILVKDYFGNKISSADLGHGVTQMLSILINIERHIYEKGDSIKPYTICIEEPEVSLHPSWQSALGRIFYDAAVNYGIHFIIETHSEYLIRATQAIVANTINDETGLKQIPFVVYYIENGGKAYDMEYQVSGRFRKPFGTGFFDEAGKSSLEIIRKERRMANGKDA